MTKLFISYRRGDSQHAVDRLYEALRKHLPKKDIFIDVDNIPKGVDFADHLARHVGQCETLLAIVGPQWLSLADETGRRRLDSPDDFVRIEIAAALKRNIPVVPVLLDGTPMPKADQLPTELRGFERRNAAFLSRDSFRSDMDKLIEDLGLKPKLRWQVPAIGASIALAAGLGALFATGIVTLPSAPLAESTLIESAVETTEDERAGIAQADTSTETDVPSASNSDSASSAIETAPAAALAASVEAWTRPAATSSRTISDQTEPPPPSSQRAAGDVFSDCTGCPLMIVVPTGSFTMGSPSTESGRLTDEGPQRTVTIGSNFAVGRYEVTWAEWDACVADGGCSSSGPDGKGGDGTWGKGKRPVINVSWDDAQAYVSWLSRKTGVKYRLLSEAEWEYAARAGTSRAYWWGSSASHEYANYGTDECCSALATGRDQWEYTAPVGSFPANAFGLYDMHGNVWEWTQDCWNESYRGAPKNGSAWTSEDCSGRVVRGGSWYGVPRDLRSAYRRRDAAALRFSDLGFRVARTL